MLGGWAVGDGTRKNKKNPKAFKEILPSDALVGVGWKSFMLN